MLCKISSKAKISDINKSMHICGSQDVWSWCSLQKHTLSIIRPDHLDNTVFGCCAELPFGHVPCSFFLPFTFSPSVLLISLAKFVIGACFALKSVTSIGIRKLDWNKCIQFTLIRSHAQASNAVVLSKPKASLRCTLAAAIFDAWSKCCLVNEQKRI